MKLKKVAAICGKTGIFQLIDQVEENGEIVCQWLGDAAAFYPISGLPYMGMDNICAMFDVPEKKREKLLFRHGNATDSINWEDTDAGERQLDEPKLCVRHGGREMLLLRTSEGVTFIQEKYLEPLDNLDYLRLYERKIKGGGLYIVAKIGMVIQAVIMPMDVLTDSFVDNLDELTRMCRAALLKKNRMQAMQEQEERKQEKGALFQVGEGAGEGAGE